MSTIHEDRPAPADARPHAPWPLWRIVLAYAALAALAAGGIWYVDLKAHQPPPRGGRLVQPPITESREAQP